MYRGTAGIALFLAAAVPAVIGRSAALSVSGGGLLRGRSGSGYRQSCIFFGYTAGVFLKVEGGLAGKAYGCIYAVEAFDELAYLCVYTESGEHLSAIVFELIGYFAAAE
jgi:hypothetical protein